MINNLSKEEKEEIAKSLLEDSDDIECENEVKNYKNEFKNYKNKLREGYRPLKTVEIEQYFRRWVKIDYTRRRFKKITHIMEHIVDREMLMNNNDIGYLKLEGNQTGFSSIVAKLCIKYNASCRKFNDGKSRIDDEGDEWVIPTKRYAVILI